jgi:hypothetical protein
MERGVLRSLSKGQAEAVIRRQGVMEPLKLILKYEEDHIRFSEKVKHYQIIIKTNLNIIRVNI